MRSLLRALFRLPVVEDLWGGEGLPFTATLAAFVLGFVMSPDEAAIGFYEATAQIIPVLLLLLAVELRFLDVPIDELVRRLDEREATAASARISRPELERWLPLFEPPDAAELALFDPAMDPDA